MFEHLIEIATTSTPSRCTRKASAILAHGADRRPVAAYRTERGTVVHFCASCAAYVRAERWLLNLGVNSPSEIAIRTAARLIGAQGGYEPPKAPDHRAGGEWFYLRSWERSAIARRLRRETLGPNNEIQAVRVLFVARDACPDPQCLRRDGHSPECGLTFGESFAERIKKAVG